MESGKWLKFKVILLSSLMAFMVFCAWWLGPVLLPPGGTSAQLTGNATLANASSFHLLQFYCLAHKEEKDRAEENLGELFDS